eukprot:2241561-Rhodomonas_salina.2
MTSLSVEVARTKHHRPVRCGDAVGVESSGDGAALRVEARQPASLRIQHVHDPWRRLGTHTHTHET